MTILVIEDDPDQAFYYQRKLEKRHEVHFAERLEGGIEKCNRFKPDVIMVDLGLPDTVDYEDTIVRLSKVQGKAALVIASGREVDEKFLKVCMKLNTDGIILKGRGDRTSELLDAELEKAVRHRKRTIK